MVGERTHGEGRVMDDLRVCGEYADWPGVGDPCLACGPAYQLELERGDRRGADLVTCRRCGWMCEPGDDE